MEEKELKELITQALQAGEDIRQKYNGKAKDMPADEMERWEAAMNDADKYKAQLELVQKQAGFDTWAKAAADRFNIKGKSSSEKAPAIKAFWRLIQNGPQSLNADDIGLIKQNYQIDDPAGGGYWQTPQEVSETILVLLKDLSFIRKAATVMPLKTAGSLGIPSVDVDPSDTDWTTELATGTLETTLAPGKRELKTNPMAKQVKMSKTLIRKLPNFEEVFMDRLSYKVDITEEKAFLTGNGQQRPLGVFVASPNGISTNRDVVAASSNAIVADDLINTLYSLKASYRKDAKWLLNRTVVQLARKFKDANGNYLWSTGLGPGTGYQGEASTLLGLPIWESEYAPNTVTTGLYTALVGNFEYYWIADALDMEIQVLYELYALTNQVGYVLRKETDGMPVLEEAFARLKQA